MGRPKKTIREYEREASKVNGCLIHPTAHIARHIYQLRHGSLPTQIHVCHKCDTPLCILNRHHFTGSNLDNMRDSVRKGRKKAAMNRLEVRALQSKVQKARFKDPAARQVMVDAFNRPEVKARKSAAIKAARSNPEVNARMAAAAKAGCNKPKELARRRAATKKLYEDPEYRARQCRAQRLSNARPEVVAAHRQGALRMWENPKYVTKQRKAQTAMWARRKAARA